MCRAGRQVGTAPPAHDPLCITFGSTGGYLCPTGNWGRRQPDPDDASRRPHKAWNGSTFSVPGSYHIKVSLTARVVRASTLSLSPSNQPTGAHLTLITEPRNPMSGPSLGRTHGPISAVWVLLLTVGMGGMTACASGERVEDARPLDAGQLAQNAQRASALDAPYRLVFDWSLNEPGMRLQGQGVARIEPPYRARLDLFARNGERITSAALVDGDLRVPEGQPSFLPQSTFFWGSLGVFRPDRSMGLAGGSWHRDGLAELRYLPTQSSELLVRLAGSRVQEMVRRSNGRAVEDLKLDMVEGERFPRQATYRDLRETRELRLTLDTVEHVESYPSDTWTPRR